MTRALWTVLMAGTLLGADLAAVKAEPNLEKRSEKALAYAGEVLTGMRAELDRNDVEKIKTQLLEFQAAVDLSVDSLTATGKNARRSPKYFKRAEVRLRELQRRLETFRRDMPFDDRPVLDGVLAHVGKKIDGVVEATLRGS
jgi:cytochrome c556